MTRKTIEGRRLYLHIFYRGPWERLMDLLLGTRPGARLVEDGSLREWFSRYPELRDKMWRERYVQSGRNPHRIWKRRARRDEA